MSDRIEAVFLSFEAVPFAKVGGLGDVAGALPDALAEAGVNCRLVMPRFGDLDPEEHGLEEVEVPPDWFVGIRFEHHPFRVWRGTLEGGAEVWMIGDERYFGRPGIYGEPGGGAFPDELERIVFFAKGAVELMKLREWRPDVIHANDHQTAAALAYVRETYAHEPAFADTALVFAIHNLAYQGVYGPEAIETLGFPRERFRAGSPFELHGALNLMRLGIHHADRIVTVSPTYAREIMGPEQGAGLEEVLRGESSKVRGILNGIDERIWSPDRDPRLPHRYGIDDLDGKRGCKGVLMSRFGLDLGRIDWPLVGSVGRLVPQKGVDAILAILDDLLRTDACFVALGSGSKDYEEALRAVAARHPGRCGVRIGFDEDLAHLLTAGCDVFLMPSRYEPCGLNQMYAMRYGTPPVVRRTGGLADTVEEWTPASGSGTGFLFDRPDGAGLGDGLGRALHAHRDRRGWARLVRNGMTRDFSWSRRAEEYRALYEEAMAARRAALNS